MCCQLFSTSSCSSVLRVAADCRCGVDTQRRTVSVPESTQQLGGRQLADVLADKANKQQTVTTQVVDNEVVDLTPVTAFQLDGFELPTNVRRLAT